MKILQHPGIVCRDFVQREGTEETTFVLNSPYATFGVGRMGFLQFLSLCLLFQKL